MAKKVALIGAVILLLDVVAAAAWAARRSTSSSPPRTALAAGTARGESAGTLSLRILRSSTARRIENAYVPVTAKGIYVIMEVSATNTTAAPVALSGDRISLELQGATYVVASAGLQGLELAGYKPLPGSSLRPAGTTTGWLAFDVPVQAVASVPELCVGGASCLPAPLV